MRRRDIVKASVGGITASFAGCIGGEESGNNIEIAGSHYPLPPCTLTVLIGQEEGIFEDHDITISDVTSFAGGGNTVRGIATGGIGAGAGVALPAVVNSYNSGAPLHLVGLNCKSIDHAWQTRPDSDIESIQDLSGKTVAVSSEGSVSEAGIIRAIENADGISLDEVDILYAGGLGECITVVREGEAAATWNLPPGYIQAEQNNELRTIFMAREYAPNITEGTMVMGQQMLDNSPEVAESIVRAMIDGNEYIKNNVERAAEIWAETNDYPEELAKEALQDVNPDQLLGAKPEKEVLDATAETMISQGVVDEIPDWNEIVRQDPLPSDMREDFS